MRTEHRDQASFCPFALREVSVLAELALGHLRYSLTDVPPQSNSPPGSVLESDHAGACVGVRRAGREIARTPRVAAKATAATTNHEPTASRHSTRLARKHRDSRHVETDGARVPPNRVSKETMKVVVFHRRRCRLPLMLHLSCLLTVPD